MKKRTVLTFLSQGAAGGACGSFLANCVVVLFYPNAYNFLIVIVVSFNLLLGALIGSAIGVVIWIPVRLVNRNLSVWSRIAISILFTMLLSVLPSFVEDFEITLLYPFVSQVAFAIPIGMLTGSSIRPWRLIARGNATRPRLKVLFRRDPIRISRSIQELEISFLVGLPLRAASLLGLMISLVATACFLSLLLVNWHSNDWDFVAHLADDFLECLVVTLYFAATVFVSFNPRYIWAALGMAFFLHVPLAIWTINNLGLSPNRFLMVLGAFFFGLWLIFVTGLLCSTEKGPLQVEYGHTETRFGRQQWVKEIG